MAHKRKLKLPCLLLVIELFGSSGALAGEGYFDYFFRQPGFAGGKLAVGFTQVLANIDRRNYKAADQLMDRIVAKLDEDKIDASVRARLLADAGILKAVVSGGDQAMPLLDQSINTVELSSGPFSALLYNMLMAEGMIHLDARDFSAAEESFRRAQHILHRQNGVYTRKQLPVLEQLTDIDQLQGTLLDADREQRFYLRISERAYGANGENLVPALEKVGAYFANRGDGLPVFASLASANANAIVYDDWLKGKISGQDVRSFRTSMFDESVGMYERAIKILEDKYGPDDLRLVEPLKGLSEARLLERSHTNLSEDAMERAVKIVESNPATDVEDRIKVLVSLGDLYTITSDSRAHDRYLEAWGLLHQHPELGKLQNQLFGAPRRLFPEARTITVHRRPMETPANAPLYADIQFSVSPDGTPQKVQVIDGNIGYGDQSEIKRYFRSKVRYRPRIVEGQFVTTPGLVFHQTCNTLEPAPSPDKSGKRTQVASRPEPDPG